jgi:hypothetical protein
VSFFVFVREECLVISFFVRVGLIYGGDATCVQDGGVMLIEEHLTVLFMSEKIIC